MPSKTTFALVAVLAATSVSALPTRGSWVDLVERAPDAPAAVVPGSGVVAAPPVVNAATVQPPAGVLPPAGGVNSVTGSGSGTGAPHPNGHHAHPHQHHLGATGLTHHHANHPQNHNHHHQGTTSVDGTSTPKRKSHRRRRSNSNSVAPPTLNTAATTPGSGAGTPVTPTTSTPSLNRREYYESLYVRDPTGHHHSPHHPNGPHHPHPQQFQTDSTPPPSPPVQDQAPSLQGRELLERRGLLETLGLKARVSNLTAKQTTQMNAAKQVCRGLSSKKDEHTCNKDLEKIVQMTKERNYGVKRFIDLTNHHDVFTSSDPSLSSSSSH
jgi:hypothetical protein